MTATIYDPLFPDVDIERRRQVQEDFGRHVVEQRNRMAMLVRKWIESESKFPTPLYDRLIDRVRQMEPSVRADVASVALLMADQIVEGILTAFALGDEMIADGRSVNYAIVAQIREPGSEDVLAQVDVNRGKPVTAIWKAYSRWLNRYAPSDLRPDASTRAAGRGKKGG